MIQREPRKFFKWSAPEFFLILIILLAVAKLLPIGAYIIQGMQFLQSVGPLGLVALSFFYLIACVFMVPGSLLTMGAGVLAAAIWHDNFALGLFFGVMAVSFGSVAGASAAFYIGRTFARGWVEQRIAVNAKFSALDKAVAENGFKMVFLVRLSPVFPFTFLNYALGLTRVRFTDYFWASWLGMLPGTVMYVYLGMGIQGVASLAGGAPETPSLAAYAFRAAGFLATLAVVAYVTGIARRAISENSGITL